MLHPDTFYWHGFKFTQCRTDGEVTGLEVTCYHPKHNVKGVAACRRKRSFAAHGGRDLLMRKLKHWALECKSCSTREKHVFLQAIPDSEVPTEEALEATAIAVFADAAAASS